jgi:hypothetical protein
MPQNPRPDSSSGAPPTRRRSGTHLVPSDQQRSAADAFLRGEPLDPETQELLDRAVAQFGWAEHEYIAESRAQGDHSRIWGTTRWIIANALARQAAVLAGRG